MNRKPQDCYLSEDMLNLVVQYRGNFIEEIDKIEYACGTVITDRTAVISVPEEYILNLRIDVPSITSIQHKDIYVLQDISPTNANKINSITSNIYLGLNGRDVLVGIVDTGIDYLNKEFIREDGTSRIVSMWDQTVKAEANSSQYIGKTFSNDEINRALDLYKNNGDPYFIVPTKDEIGHGTKIASIIGARGYDESVRGIAPDCNFVIVKLQESNYYKKMLKDNGINNIPVYNGSELLTGINYLKEYATSLSKPMVIYIGLGSTEGSHDGKNFMSKYLTTISEIEGIVVVTGVGNEGSAQGHKSGMLSGVGSIETVELNIPRVMKKFYFYIWVRMPDRMSLNIIAPNGQESSLLTSKVDRTIKFKFALIDTSVLVRYFMPDNFTGNELIEVSFNNIKPGIWKFQLRGDYITNGRYDIWLPPNKVLPEGTNFFEPDPFTTLAMPSTSTGVISVAYYDEEKRSLIPSSGKGFDANEGIKPSITAAGINIITTSTEGKISTLSGSSAATAIVAGACALILQWGVINGNDRTMSSTKVESYLIYGADRKWSNIFNYPNRDIGYGILDLVNVFNIVIGTFRFTINRNFDEYYINNLFIRMPRNNGFIKRGSEINE